MNDSQLITSNKNNHNHNKNYIIIRDHILLSTPFSQILFTWMTFTILAPDLSITNSLDSIIIPLILCMFPNTILLLLFRSFSWKSELLLLLLRTNGRGEVFRDDPAIIVVVFAVVREDALRNVENESLCTAEGVDLAKKDLW